MKKLLLASLLTLTLTGCETYWVVYDSYPQSARIVCDGQMMGETPFNQQIELSDELIARGYLPIGNCEALWVSGARTALPPTVATNTSRLSLINVARPNAPGLENDILYDSERKKVQIEEKRLREEEERRYIEMRQLHEMQVTNMELRRQRHELKRLRHEKPTPHHEPARRH